MESQELMLIHSAYTMSYHGMSSLMGEFLFFRSLFLFIYFDNSIVASYNRMENFEKLENTKSVKLQGFLVFR